MGPVNRARCWMLASLVALLLCGTLALSSPAQLAAQRSASAWLPWNAQLAQLAADLDNPALILLDAVEFTSGSMTTVVCVWGTAESLVADPPHVWTVPYTFPSSIFAHSIVKVKMHAEEMD